MGCPALARAKAVRTAVVVLPAPPLVAATTMMGTYPHYNRSTSPQSIRSFQRGEGVAIEPLGADTGSAYWDVPGGSRKPRRASPRILGSSRTGAGAVAFLACRPYPSESNGYAAFGELRHPSAVGAFCVLAHSTSRSVCCPQQTVLFAVPVERG